MKGIRSLIPIALLAALVISLVGCSAPTSDTQGEDGTDLYYWDETELVIQLTDNTNGDDHTPGLRRYLAGEDSATAPEEIRRAVIARNEKSLADSRVRVRYTYLDNVAGYGCGQNSDRIVAEAASDAPDRPDIYGNFAHDLALASLHGAFADLYSTDYGRGQNYLNLRGESADDCYLDEYMSSFAISDDRRYVLASDYTIDVIRAFNVIPMNLELLERITSTDGRGEGALNAQALRKLVADGDFTYGTVAALSAACEAYSSDNPGAEGVLGLALNGNWGPTAAAILYSSDVEILVKDGSGECHYSDDPTRFTAICNALTALVEGDGVQVFDRAYVEERLGKIGHPYEAIRNVFADGGLLLGGPITVAELEAPEYHGMIKQGKLAILPLPIYSAESTQNGYKSVASHQAHVLAISKGTTAFEQCTAHLAHQSRGSAPVLAEYLNATLTPSEATQTWDNAELIYMMRELENGNFDYYYEFINKDGISFDPAPTSWHRILLEHSYRVTDPAKEYSDEIGNRLDLLESTLDEWKALKSEKK